MVGGKDLDLAPYSSFREPLVAEISFREFSLSAARE